jgi:hypothetical protein
MRLSPSVLTRLRGSVLIAAVVGCTTPDAAPPPADPELLVVPEPVAIDPVSYDGANEIDRLARVDRVDQASATVRAERIEHGIALARDERARREQAEVMSVLSGIRRDQIMASCGRG